MTKYILTKSDFLDFCACSKSLWLHKHKPEVVDWPTPTEFERLLMQNGMAIEQQAKELVATWEDATSYEYQRTFETDDGLHARTDLVRQNEDGSVDIWEIKASTSVKSSTGDHILDAGFQTLVAERSGVPVRTVGIVHVNKDYVRQGAVDPAALLTFADVTEEVRQRLPDIEQQVDTALSMLALEEIDEASCDCLMKSKNQHCASFGYFNPGVPTPSIYNLPNLSAKQRNLFVPGQRFLPSDIEEKEVTPGQLPVLIALKSGAPVIDIAGIRSFCDPLEFPLYFYDYETYGSAIPIVDGHHPHEQMPVQVSLHRLDADGHLEHKECLTEHPGAQNEIVNFLRTEIGETGNLISWNASFENSCNKRMSRLMPEQTSFLEGLNQRTRDLMDLFKAHYVHPDFGGSTSIKKVLPVLVSTLKYDQDSVHDGAGAVEAWYAMVNSNDPKEQAVLRDALLAYCKLDTLAMVEIYRAIQVTVQAAS